MKKIFLLFLLILSSGCVKNNTSSPSTIFLSSSEFSNSSTSLNSSSSSSVISNSTSSSISNSTQTTSSNNNLLGKTGYPLVPGTCPSLSITLMEITGSSYGDAIFVTCGDNFNMIIDAGNFSGTSSNDGVRMYNKYIKPITNKYPNGKRKIDMLITTHADGDHMGGIDSVIPYAVTQTAYIVDFGYISDKYQYTNYYKPAIERQKQGGAKYCSYNDALNSKNDCSKRVYLMDDLYIDFLNSGLNVTTNTTITDNTSLNDNDASVIFLMTYKNNTYFFGGDMTGTAGNGTNIDNNIINDKDFKKNVTFFKASHHGAVTYNSNSSTLLTALKPKYIGVSAQLKVYEEGTQIAHPNQTVISRFLNYTNEIYYNGVNGDLTFTSSGDGILSIAGTVPERGYAINNIKITNEETTKLTDSQWYNTCYGSSSSARTCSIQ